MFLVSSILNAVRDSLVNGLLDRTVDFCQFVIRPQYKSGSVGLDLSAPHDDRNVTIFESNLRVGCLPKKGDCVCLLPEGERYYANFRVLEVVQTVSNLGIYKDRWRGSSKYKIYIERINPTQ